MLQINRKYISISGEVGTVIPQGTPCLIIRTQGCNLQCGFCDAKETQGIEGGQQESIEELMSIIIESGLPVLLTGGEPLMQAASIDLIQRCSVFNIPIQIETNGTIDVTGIVGMPNVGVIMDVKPNEISNVVICDEFDRMTKNDWLKFMVTNDFETDMAINKIEMLQEAGVSCHFAISSTQQGFQLPSIMEKMMMQGVRATLNVQLHKVLNMP